MRKEELRTYIENHESEMIEDLKSLIRIPRRKTGGRARQTIRRTGGRSTGAGNRNSGKNNGFAVTNYDNYAIAADFNQERKGP